MSKAIGKSIEENGLRRGPKTNKKKSCKRQKCSKWKGGKCICGRN